MHQLERLPMKFFVTFRFVNQLKSLKRKVKVDGSLSHFKAGQQRKAERNKSNGKFDPRKTNYKSGKAIKSPKKLSKAELGRLIADLNYKSQKRKKSQLVLLIFIVGAIILLLIALIS